MFKIDTYKVELNKIAQSLKGQKIQNVFYWEIDYGNEEYNYVDYHTIDYGISFTTQSNSSYYIIWDSKCVQFDIKISKGDIKTEFNVDSNIKTIDVSNIPKWKKLINKEIIDAKVVWYSNINAPQDILLDFENSEKVIFSSSEVWDDKKAKGMSDNIIVFFNADIASDYGLTY